MSIDLTCPACSARNSFADDQAGRLGKCGKCKTPVYVPLAEELPSGTPSMRSSGKPGRIDMYLLFAAVLAGIFVGAFGSYFITFEKTPASAQGPAGNNPNPGPQANPNDPGAAIAKQVFLINNNAFESGHINGPLDARYYRLIAPVTGRLKISLNYPAGSSLDSVIQVFSGNLNNLVLSGHVNLEVDVASQSVYYVKVAARPQATGSATNGAFNLNLSMGAAGIILKNPAWDSAIPVAMDLGVKEVNGVIAFAGESRSYRITPSDSGRLEVELRIPFGSRLDGKLNGQPVMQVQKGQAYFITVSSYSPPLQNKQSVGAFILSLKLIKENP